MRCSLQPPPEKKATPHLRTCTKKRQLRKLKVFPLTNAEAAQDPTHNTFHALKSKHVGRATSQEQTPKRQRFEGGGFGEQSSARKGRRPEPSGRRCALPAGVGVQMRPVKSANENGDRPARRWRDSREGGDQTRGEGRPRATRGALSGLAHGDRTAEEVQK